MMGTLLPHARVPVVKGTSGILLLDAKEAEALEPEACIRCGSCVKACPMGLLPLEMSARIRNDDLDGAMDLGLADCIACGCCAYVCPSHIPLVQYFYHAKGDLSARERAKLRTESTKKLALPGRSGWSAKPREGRSRRQAQGRAGRPAGCSRRSRGASQHRTAEGRNRMNLATLQGEAIASPHAHGGNTVGRTMVRVQLRWCRPPSTASGCSAGRRSSCGC
jgi:electron transport complex protein RnfC